MSYLNKLKSPLWQKKRLEILNRDKFTCQDCGGVESTLHVHHIAYYKEPWDCPNELLVTLCEDCHENESHDLKIVTKNLIENMKKSGLRAKDLLDVSNHYYHKSKV